MRDALDNRAEGLVNLRHNAQLKLIYFSMLAFF
ncbi:hypothetical protein FHU10_2173 [Serratia fonticola]|uniref:Uncharacterized protein n=1 Tax=Serratia fonticola TaxID=47917 RepID=A0A559T4W0_SERFO|nr:hypothetical protein FHU09_0278 [Serratia fonticola]TQI95147.1 hypothetical protein FHU11_0514 [Serratia fonticola]TVZ69645.1 hypothetical protein FHU10_2173 [Serratia fonticola]